MAGEQMRRIRRRRAAPRRAHTAYHRPGLPWCTDGLEQLVGSTTRTRNMPNPSFLSVSAATVVIATLFGAIFGIAGVCRGQTVSPRIPRHTERIEPGTKRRDLRGQVVEIFKKEGAVGSDEQRRPLNAPSDSPIGVEEPTKLGTSTPPAGVGLFSTVQAMFEEISSEILSRWGAEYADTELFSGGMRFSDGGRVVEDKMLKAVLEQKGFLAAFTGISTTAGHDCLYEESYPIVFNATMSRLMATSGVRFEAINVAMGNTRIAPYSFCVDAHAGVDADIISWEMSMEAISHECGKAAAAVELFVRSATVLPKHPAVLIMDASPDVTRCETAGSGRGLYQQLVGACDPNRSLMKVYRDFGLHQLSPRDLVRTLACDDDRFSRDRLYNRTEKVREKPKSWHPAPTGHQLLADMLFMHYGKVFLSALGRLEELAPGITGADLKVKDGSSRTALMASLGLWSEASQRDPRGDDRTDGNVWGAGRGDALPPPAWCGEWHFCHFAGDYRCANTFFPLAGKEGSRLLDMVSEVTPDIVNRDRAVYQANLTEGHWAVTLNEDNPNVVAYLLEPAAGGKHKPIDKKWVLVGDRLSGPIDLEFETVGFHSEVGAAAAAMAEEDSTRTALPVGVCRPSFIDRVNFSDPTEVKFKVDGVETSVVPLEHRGVSTGSCVLLEADIGVGKHSLTVEPLRDGQLYVAISHMLYPA